MRTIRAGRPATLSVTFVDDDTGAALDPGEVEVAVVRDDGTDQTVAAAVAGDGTDPRTVTLTAEEIGDDPDRLTVTWTSDGQGRIVEHVDVVGGWIVPLHLVGGSASAEAKRKARDWFEAVAEDHCGVAFRPRYGRADFRGPEGPAALAWRWTWTELVLDVLQLREVRWATVDGVAVDVTDWIVTPWGRITPGTAITAGRHLAIGFTHGYDAPPADLVDAGVLAVKDRASRAAAGMDLRRMTETDLATGATTRLSVASNRYPVGIPDVDAVLNRLKER